MRIFVLGIVMGVFVLLSNPAKASAPKADAITSQFLQNEYGYQGDQTTFEGLLRLLKKHEIGIINNQSGGFDFYFSISEFQPFTPEQSDALIKTIFSLKPSDKPELRPYSLLGLVIDQKVGPSGLEWLKRMAVHSPDIHVRRISARIILTTQNDNAVAIETLTKIAEPAMMGLYARVDDVETVRVLAILDLLYSTSKDQALRYLEKLSHQPAFQQILSVFLSSRYGRVAGPSFLITFVRNLQKTDETLARRFLLTLNQFDPQTYIQIADAFEWSSCDELLAAYLNLEWKSPWRPQWPQ
jgi:hypothetical protein